MKISLQISKTKKADWENYLRSRYNKPKASLITLLHVLMEEQLNDYKNGTGTIFTETKNLQKHKPSIIIGKGFN